MNDPKVQKLQYLICYAEQDETAAAGLHEKAVFIQHPKTSASICCIYLLVYNVDALSEWPLLSEVISLNLNHGCASLAFGSCVWLSSLALSVLSARD